MKSVNNIKSFLSSKVTSNIIWLFIERGIQVVVGLLITGLFARSLGTQGYGMYQYASAIIVVVMSFTYVCGSEVLVPLLTRRNPNEIFGVLYNAFVIRLISSVFVFLGLIAYLFFSNFTQELKLLIGLWGLVILVNEPFAVIRTWMESNTYIKPNVVIRIVSLLIKVLLVYTFYILKLEIFWIGLILFLEALSLSLGQVLYFKYSFKSPKLFALDKKIIITLLKSGGAFFISIILMFLFSKIDKIVLKEYVSFSELGLYTSAMAFTDQLNAIAPIISISFAPMFVYKELSNPKAIRNVIRITGILIFLSIGIALLVSVFSNTIVRFIFGNSFENASGILAYSVWVCVIVFVDSGLNLLLYRNNAYKVLIAKWFVAFLINFIVVLLFVDKLSIYAGVLGVYLGYLFSVLISIYFFITTKRSVSEP